MSDEIFFDGVRYISAGDAALSHGLSRDYVAKLCREGKIQGKRVGKNWYTSELALKEFLVTQEFERSRRRESLANERAREYNRHNGPAPLIRMDATEEDTLLGIGAHVLRGHNKAIEVLQSAKRMLPSAAMPQGLKSLHGKLAERAAKHGQLLSDAARGFTNPGLSDAAVRTIAHVPLYSVSPVGELLQKATALALAFMLTFGTYALVDKNAARFAIESTRDSIRDLTGNYREITGGGIAQAAARAEAQVTVAVEHPGASLAAVAGFFPERLANFAKALNTTIDGAIYAVAFPSGLVERELAGSTDGAHVAVEIAPYARPAAAPEQTSIVASTQATPRVTVQTSQNTPTTVIHQPVIERIIERSVPQQSVAAAGGLTDAYLQTKLNQLENKLTAQMYALSSANSTAITGNYVVTAQTNKIDELTNVEITNPTLSGGTIEGTEIRGGSLTDASITGTSIGATTLSVSGATTLATTTITGDVTLTGSLSLTGTTSAATLSATNATITNATSTNFFAVFSRFTVATVSDLTATDATISELIATNAVIANATTTNGYTSYFTSDAATSTTFFATNLSATSATSTNLSTTNFTGTNATTTNFFTTRLSVDSLTLGSGISSHFVPSANDTYDLGSASFYWRNGYIDTITVNNISAASTSIGGTASESFTLNSDNATADTEDMNLIFYRGTVVPNAVFSWNSAGSAKRFEMNQPLFISNLSGSTTQPTLTLKGSTGQTANIFQIASSSGTNVFTVASDGAVTISTTTITALTTGTSTLTNLTVTNTNVSTFAGSLGIGTTTTDASLVVNASGANVAAFDRASVRLAMINGGNDDFNLVPRASANVRIGTFGSAAFNVLSGGNVGIGTTTPVARLGVAGNAFIGDGTQAGGLTVFGGATTTQHLVVQGTATSTFTGGLQVSGTGFRINNSVAANSFLLTNAGELSLGTASPLGRLYMAGTYTTANPYAVRFAPTLVSSLTSTQYMFAVDGSFNPSGATLSNAYGVYSNPNISGSALDIGNFGANAAIIQTSAGYTGTITNAYAYRAQGPSLLGTNPVIGNYYGLYVDPSTNGNATTSGTVNNFQIRTRSNTAAAGSGGTVNNYGVYVDIPTGSGAGTTNNYGLRLTLDGGAAGAGTTNWALFADTQAPSYFESTLAFGDTGKIYPSMLWVATSSVSTTTSQIGIRSARAAIVANNLLGGIDFWSNDTNLTAPGTRTAAIQAIANTTHTASALGTDLVFNTTSGTTYSEAMRITGDNKVGIGTTSPWGKLAVAADNASNPQFVVASSTNIGFLVAANGNVGIAGVNATANNPAVPLHVNAFGAGAVPTLIGNEVAVFQRTNSSVTTAAIAVLGGSNATQSVYLGDTTDIDVGAIQYDNANDRFSIRTNNTSDRLVVDSSGNIGVGTTSPTNKLEVAGNTFLGGNVVATGTLSVAGATTQTGLLTMTNGFVSQASSTVVGNFTTTGQYIAAAGTAAAPAYAFSSNLASGLFLNSVSGPSLVRSGTEAIRITGGAVTNIIGGTYSTGQLHVGTTTEGGKIGFARASDGASAAFIGRDTQTGNGFGLMNASGASDATIFFGTNSVERMRITMSGRVGIGTTSPTNLLSISGGSYDVDGRSGGYKIDNVLILQASSTRSSLMLGSGAGNTSYTGSSNFALGTNALTALTSGANNIAIGANALVSATSSSQDVAIGTSAMQFFIEGSGGTSNLAVGYQALQGQSGLSFGVRNVALGERALRFGTTGSRNNALGYAALQANTTGSDNIAMGHAALIANTVGAANVAIGNNALGIATSSSGNTAIGQDAMSNFVGAQNPGTFEYNTAVGLAAVQGASGGMTSSQNTGVGQQVISRLTTGGANSGLGYRAGLNISTGAGNIVIGASVGQTLTTGSYNTLIGSGFGGNTLADVPSASTSHFLNIMNMLYGVNTAAGGTIGAGTTTPWGVLSASSTSATIPALVAEQRSTGPAALLLGGSVGIGTTSPWARLAVSAADNASANQFVVASSSRVGLIVTAAGNVGISTATAGLTALSDSNDTFLTVKARGGNRAGVVELGGASGGNYGAGNPIGVVRFTNDNGTNIAVADIRGSNYAAGNNGQLHFLTASGGSLATAMTIHTNQNVGIGTTTPDSFLQVNGTYGGTNKPQLKLSTPNTSDRRTEIAFSQAGTTFFRIGTDISANNTNDLWIHDQSAGATRLMINSSGNIGIGTTTPNNKLSVAGTHNTTQVNLLELGTSGGSAGTGNGILFTHAGASVGGIRTLDDGASKVSLRFDTYASGLMQNRMVISGDGLVGIGTSSPQTRLHVSRTASVNQSDTAFDLDSSDTILRLENAGPSFGSETALGLGAYTTTGYRDAALITGKFWGTSNYDSGRLAFSTSNSGTLGVRMVIDSSGNVGVGTTSPTNKLSVSGGSFDVDGRSGGYKIDNALVLQASSTNLSTLVGMQQPTLTSGTWNTSLGYQALNSATSSSGNTAVGYQALLGTTVSNSGFNTAIGYQTLRVNTSGSDNTAVGQSAMRANTTGVNNAAFGASALLANTTGNNNTAVGWAALAANTSGSFLTAIGREAMAGNTTGGSNIAIGYRSMQIATSSSLNIAIGEQTLANLQQTGQTANIAIGASAGNAVTTGTNNTLIGYQSGLSLTTGSSNVMIGNTAGKFATSSSQNTLIGVGTGINIAQTLGPSFSIGSTFVGYEAGNAVTSGTWNTLLGHSAARQLTTGGSNVAVGRAAYNALTTGGFNTGLGHAAGFNIVSGGSNVCVGNSACSNPSTLGAGVETGSYNIGIGEYAGATGDYSNTVALGNYAGPGASNVMVLGSASSTYWMNVGVASSTPWGKLSVLANDNASMPQLVVASSSAVSFLVAANGNVGIGTTSPAHPLDVWGTTPLQLGRSGVGAWSVGLTNNTVTGDSGTLRFTPTGGQASPSGITIADSASATKHFFGTTGNAYHAGSLGIGTTSPQALLHVGNGINISNWVFSNLASPDLLVSTTSAAAAMGVLVDSGSTNLRIGLFADAANDLVGIGTNWNGGSGRFDIRNGSGSPSLTITSGGNVGINATTTPWGKFSVLASANASIPQFVVASSSAVSLIVTEQGQLGVKGVTSMVASTALEATGNILVSSSQQFGSASDGRQRWTPAGSGGSIFNTTAAHIWQNDSIERMRLTLGGNLGIGTSSPYAKLSISANNGETNTTLFAIASSTASATTTFVSVSNIGDIEFTTGASGSLHLQTLPDPDHGGATGGYYLWARQNNSGGRVLNFSESGSSGNNRQQFSPSGILQGSGMSFGFTSTSGMHPMGTDSPDTYIYRQAAGVLGTQGLYASSSVGIGTTTPFSHLTVGTGDGTQRDLGVFNGAICADDGGSTKCYGALTAGVVYGDSSNFAASDVAENYFATDSTLQAGEIVALDTSTSTSVKRASPGERLLGIVSTQPGVLLGGEATSSVPVALSGRVPVRVSLENGPIMIGDNLSLSSTPGVAKRAAAGEATIGVALENYTIGLPEGAVMVFVENGQQQDYAGLAALMSIASSTDALESGSLAEGLWSNMLTRVSAWLASTTNGITDFFAGKVHTKELCVEKSDGTEICVTGDQLAAALAGTPSTPSTPSSPSTPSDSGTGGQDESAPDTEAPVITVSGANPATIEIGQTYSDLGATLFDIGSPNIGISASVDGGATTTIEMISIDTSSAGEHTILYSATDQAGNTGTAERTVNVVAPEPQQP